MAEFKLSRLRYTWRGNWTQSTAYNKDDVVYYGGGAWICIRQHTAANFGDDYNYIPPGDTIAQPAWTEMAKGLYFAGDWASATAYFPGTVVRYGGRLLVVNTAHTSQSTFDPDIANWTSVAESLSWKGNWSTNTRYGVDDLVRYNGIVYRCVTGHTSSSTTADGLETNQADWQVEYSGVQYIGDWTSSTRYRANDLVTYGGSLLRCITGHTAGSYITDENFVTYVPGYKIRGTWDGSGYYALGDVVQHGGYTYIATRSNNARNPSDSIYQATETTYWAIITKGVNLRGIWSAAATYQTGDVVQRGGNTYVAKLDTTDDGSTLDYLDTSNWDILVPSLRWKSAWTVDTVYSINDIVIYKGSVWQCNYEHTATSVNFPGDNGEGFYYWDILLQGSDNVGLVTPGDLLSFGLSREAQGDGSTFGATNVPIGNETDLLAVQANDKIAYEEFGINQRFFVVDPINGIDDRNDPNRGIDPFKPFKSIRFALDKSNDGWTGTTTIKLTTGLYEEVGPMIVPPRTVVQGDELRSTTIVPNPPNTDLDGETVYRFAALNHLKDVCRSIILNQSVTKSAGNAEDQVYVIDSVPTGTFTPAVVAESGAIITPAQPIFEDVPIFGNTNTADQVDGLVQSMIQYINFKVNSTGDDIDVFGTNDLTTDQNRINGGRAILANSKFLAAEIVAYLKANYPDITLQYDLYSEDVHRYIIAFEYDLKYPGNYKTALEARYYANQVQGSALDDMFYLRDATGLRDCSLKKMSGSLNPPSVFDLYQRPTGPAYCSLDPGWGPADETTWIMTRSPYIQNVSTFGENCTGQRIDGALHNGGNRSMVSNDFTQVISDGIGAHVTNNGRAELVSVFTYYAQVGYLAENGGIIRATNGNCSYGYIGALADGNDPTETPLTATLNTRTEQAIVASAFAGEVNDEILAFEFLHAGQNYTDASYTVIGSGTGVEVIQEEFRDDSLPLARIVTGESSSAAGGGGYTLIGNQAQDGDSTSITLATSDDNEEANLLGLRIIITSGDGTGQYGKVDSYDPVTKVLNVVKESDGTPGWDHIIPGYPIKDNLTTNARYRFEPRVTFTPPGFSFTDITLDAGTQWADAAYNETYKVYTSIPGTEGTGTTVDVLPAEATFDIVRNGRDYTVSIRSPGAGYAKDDTITIGGDLLGGTTPDNDITITVTDISDDSSNEITGFDYTGTAVSGVFVITPAIGTTTNYSANGEDWITGQLPSAGNWLAIAAGKTSAGRYGFVTLKANSNQAAFSFDGVVWSPTTLPTDTSWQSVAGGDGVWLAVANQGNEAAFTTNGVNWASANIPVAGDSTFDEWSSITYGKGKFVAVSSSSNVAAIGTYDVNLGIITWETTIMDVIDDSAQKDWHKISYGHNRYVALSKDGNIAYSFDGSFWYGALMPTPDGSTRMAWRDLAYGQGVFVATMDTAGVDISGDDPTAGPVDYIYTSEDGIYWQQRDVGATSNWGPVAFGNPDVSLSDGGDNRKGRWILISRDIQFTHKLLHTGCTIKGRAIVEAGQISEIRLWEPGSGYASPPNISVVDPNNTGDVVVDLTRLADRVLAQPSWVNRGSKFKTSTTTVTVSGDGFADIPAVGKFITISDINTLIGPGAQIRLEGNPELYTTVTVEREDIAVDGTFTLRLRVSPELKIEDDPTNFHGTPITINLRYSQCRITGHDFLDIGTGNFVETNYPDLYSQNYISYPENEVLEQNGGRVFYTSTDQSGNFRVGELFAVEQATGIVTISADFFDLAGLTELALGGIRVGGTGTIIREFSTDPLFTADSNNIVPTQRAIAAYLQNRLNVGGADLLTASFIAGTVRVGPGIIGNSAGLRNTIPVQARIEGDQAGVQGSMLAQAMFHRSFDKNNNR